MHKMKSSTDWLFVSALLLPAAYIAIFPGQYFALWYRSLASIPSGGFSLTILFAGAVKVSLYASTLISSMSNRSTRIGYIILAIHMGVGVGVLLMILLFRMPPMDYGMRAFYAFLMTEFLFFPILGSMHLQDVIRHRKAGLATVFLLSIGIYVCITFLAASTLVELNQKIVDVRDMTVLEAEGARVYMLLTIVAESIGSPFFWQSTSLYAIDTAPPPTWVSGLYVLALALFLYDHARPLNTTSGLGSSSPDTSLPIDTLRMAMTILTAATLSFLIALGTDLLIPHNVAGRSLQLLIVLVPLLAIFLMTTRET